MKTVRAIRLSLAVAAIVTVYLFNKSGILIHAQAPPAAVSDIMTAALQTRAVLPAADGSLWRFEGPRNILQGSHYIGQQPYSGRINDLAIDPTNTFIMYATGATGGLWKTVDRGQTWAGWSQDWPLQSATAVAIDPRAPSRIFVGTGDYKRLDHVEPFSVGIMRSLDGGVSWTGPFGGNQMRDYTVSRIVVDPVSGDVLAATGRGSRLPGGRLFRSLNLGETWVTADSAPDANWDDLRLCQQNTLWASGTRRHNIDTNSDFSGADSDPLNGTGLVFQSRDGGVTWSKIRVSTPGSAALGQSAFDLDTAGSPDVIQIACGQTRLGSVVFIAVFADRVVRIFGTIDNGNLWTEITDSSTVFDGLGGPSAHSAFAVTANKLYVASAWLWTASLPSSLVPVTFDVVRGSLMPNDQQCAVPDPNETDALFFCNDKGVYRYSPVTNAATSLNATLGVTQIHRMDVHPRHGGLIGVGAQDLGDLVSFFGKGTDAAAFNEPANWAMVIGGDGRSAAFKGDATTRVFLANSYGQVTFYDGRSYTGSASATFPLCPAPAPCDLRASNGDHQSPLLYRADVDTLDWGSQPGNILQFLNPAGLTTQRGPFSIPTTLAPARNPESAKKVQALAVCPTNSQIMYAASQLGEIFRSATGGQSWTRLNRSGISDSALAPVWAISPSPANCDDVLLAVGYEGQIFKPIPSSIRSGSNFFFDGPRLYRNSSVQSGIWTSVHGDGGGQPLPKAPIFAIVRHPSDADNVWFVAGDVGVFRTDDGGAHWSNATAPLGLPNTLARNLRLSDDGETLYVGTFGRGVWSMDVTRPQNTFGVRGIVSLGSRPVQGAVVSISGSGRIRKFLKNTLTSGVTPSTAPIKIDASAVIAAAIVTIEASDTAAASLVTPTGSVLPMTLTSGKFQLTTSSAAALVGRNAQGNWRFQLTGTTISVRGSALYAYPKVKSAFVDFQFANGIGVTTGPDGEYTAEFVSRGTHTATMTFVEGISQSRSVTFSSHLTNVNFALAPVGVSVIEPKVAKVDVNQPFTYSLAYTITEGRRWRDLTAVQVRFRDERDTILWLRFNTTDDTFSLIDPERGTSGPSFRSGAPNRLETSSATVYLSNTKIQPNTPDTSSVTLTLTVSFKPRAEGRIYNVEVFATNVLGQIQGPDLVGTLQVGNISYPPGPDVPPEQ
jgi:photosystem II stability/assembly factor-like uncharacterized protein